MITSQALYWITRLNSLRILFAVVGAVTGPFGIISMLIAYVDEEYIIKRTAKLCLLIFSISFTITMLIPSTKEMAFILTVPKIVNSETIQNIPDDLKTLKELGIDYLKSKLEGM